MKKGPDMASVAIYYNYKCDDIYDEISRYVNARSVSESEACWSISDFSIHGKESSIQCLASRECTNGSIQWK